MTDPALASRTRLRATATIRTRRLPCGICGHPIDYDLPNPHQLTAMVKAGRITPAQRTAMLRASFTVDEIIPRSRGGSATDPRNLRAAHWACNSSRGNATRRRKPKTRHTARPLVTSQPW